MGLIPQERHKQIALILGIAALGAIYLFFEYWYSPRKDEVERLETRLEQLQDQNRRAQVLAVSAGPELEERLAVYERHLMRMEELIPRSEEVPTLLRSVTQEALRHRVDMGSIRPLGSEPGEHYAKESYEMAVVGEFHDVGRFLAAVASLQRIITPVDLQLEPFRGQPNDERMQAPVVAQFRIETYIAPRNGALPFDADDF